MAAYILAAEFVSLDPSKGEVLVFRRGHKAVSTSKAISPVDEESAIDPCHQKGHYDHEATDTEDGRQPQIVRQKSIFHWKDVCYDIEIKGSPVRILDHVDGWVKPGTLTALMVCVLSWLEQFENSLTLLTTQTGCNGRRENDSSGRTSQPGICRCGFRRHPCEW